ncbi:SRPBCC domain-containing protein [Streptomyces sp. NPDC093544]|jgi:carbon monoxide dehydrogenase subunit G|uniref:SRPBCC family protein n=1 Tax=Streptomyces sp. NPDC093544 TaxID=3155200 RepID=UPI0034324E5A
MEHEVYVPVPAERLREALGDPVRVARAVPGLQQDAGTPPVSGRLKVRFGGHTITYRGKLSVAAQEDGSYAVEGDATEARGSGSVKLALAVRLAPAEGGTTVTVGGTASADGRVAELAPDAVSAAVVRLLERFVENLGAAASVPEESDEPGEPVPSESDADADVPAPSVESSVEDDLVAEGFGGEFVDEVDEEEPVPGVADSLDSLHSLDSLDSLDSVEEDSIAEAAHARRTMIGRSAEEVDHAPPRGRYAPLPAPETTAARATLRWAAPAAALALASAIVVTRALRKRR